MLILAFTIALLGTNLQYTGPNEFSWFLLGPIVDSIVSYCEMRVLAVAIEKVTKGSGKSGKQESKVDQKNASKVVNK